MARKLIHQAPSYSVPPKEKRLSEATHLCHNMQIQMDKYTRISHLYLIGQREDKCFRIVLHDKSNLEENKCIRSIRFWRSFDVNILHSAVFFKNAS